MKWIEPLTEDFLYCDPQEISSELYRVCSDEQASPAEQHQAEKHQAEQSGEPLRVQRSGDND